ncbi:MAG: polysaccharide biosynthesis/export family protein [Planctomycetota bacterium]|jgi:polysaccharide export outer membrane protein
MKRMGYWLGLACLVLLGGCPSEAYNKAIWARARALTTQPEYVIGNSDVISVRVLGEADFSVVSKTVRPDGKVSFPTHGDIDVVGKTPQGLRQQLEKDFVNTLGLRNPKVFVSVESFESKSVTIMGEVRVPGRFPYTGQMRIVDLLGRTIGWDPITAATTRVLLFRDIEGEVKIYHVNIMDMFRRGDFTTNFYLRPGDVVWVPPTGWERVARNIRKVLSPITALANAVGIGVTTSAYFVPTTTSG